jgi:hypothetical protein
LRMSTAFRFTVRSYRVRASRNQSQGVAKPDQMSGLSLLWRPSQATKAKKRRGERKAGSTVPPRSYALRTAQQACWRAAKGARRDPELAVDVVHRAV